METTIVSSSDKNVLKYVFKAPDAVAEAVLYKYPTYEERTVICCSTMSGCPMGCRFCGSGEYFVRSLKADEIVEQPVRLLKDTGVDPAKIKKLQIMFMSMGEPLLNKEIAPAIRKLHSLYPNADLLVSTSAPTVDYSWFNELSVEIDKVGLQFSVHESTDEARNKLVPFAKKLSLKGIALAGVSWQLATGRKPYFNYCVHEENNKAADVQRLQALFKPNLWNATISVICEKEESVAAANSRQLELATEFSSQMVAAGYDTRVFNPAGQDDIGGGCGQLWFLQDWMRNNPDKARKSVGFGLPKIHTPKPLTISVGVVQ